MRANRPMFAAIAAAMHTGGADSRRIREWFSPIFAGGLSVSDGLVSTPWLWERRGNVIACGQCNSTEAECAINKIYVDEMPAWGNPVAACFVLNALVRNHSEIT